MTRVSTNSSKAEQPTVYNLNKMLEDIKYSTNNFHIIKNITQDIYST